MDAEVELTGTPVHRPHGNKILNTIAHLKHYAIDMAYINLPQKHRNTENIQETAVWMATRKVHHRTQGPRSPCHPKTPIHPMGAGMERLTPCLDIRTPEIDMVYRDP
jgi:hypothetical protein